MLSPIWEQKKDGQRCIIWGAWGSNDSSSEPSQEKKQSFSEDVTLNPVAHE